MNLRGVFRVGLTLVILAAGGAAGRANELYWVNYSTGNDGSIYRADVDNFEEAEPVIAGGLHQPYRIAVEPRIGKMFWTSIGVEDAGGIFCANLDGTGIRSLVPGGTGNTDRVAALAIDHANRKLLFSQGIEIKSVNFDGSGLQSLGTPARDLIQDIAIDAVNEKIYFSDNFNPLLAIGALRRMNPDGSGVETLNSFISRGPIGLDVDPAGGKVYWARAAATGIASIDRSNLDGTQRENLVTANGDSLSLDLDAGKVYWSFANGSSAPGLIRRANLDGSNVETVYSSTTFAPGGIAITPEPGTGAAFLLIMAVVRFRRRCAF